MTESVLPDAPRETFTRDELLAAMTISPCHITGTHDPQHTPKYVCTHQAKDALTGVLALLDLTPEDLPRKPHTWPASGAGGVLEAAWVEKRPMTFTVTNIPDESFDSFAEAWNSGCDARKESRASFSVYAMTEGLDAPERVATW